ncbi:unnamed protein product [Effrenium voratum]|nr:unnamed protein product [Effrenium voratum]CAJ1439521.1 unnamed protein product [Effrenium voratum]
MVLEQLRGTELAKGQSGNGLLEAAVAAGCLELAMSTFKEMKSNNSRDVSSCNIMLRALVTRKGGFQQAKDLMEEMAGSGLRPNTASFNILLGAAVAQGDLDFTWRTIDKMERHGPSVDAYTMSILFKGYKTRQNFDFDRAVDLVSRHCGKMDEVLVNVILEVCVGLRDTYRLSKVLQMLKRSGWDLPKHCNANTYSGLIKAFGSTNQMHKALELWADIKRQGIAPSEHMFAQMIDVLVTGGRLPQALELFEEMRQAHGDRMSSSGFAMAYAMVVKGYAQQKDAVRALQCYEEMKALGVHIGVVVLNTLIDACCRVGDMARAGELLDDMARLDIVPDLITYSTLIKGYCAKGDLDQALALFGAMRRKGIKPDAIVFNSLLDGCARKEMPALCEQVINDMIAAGVQPSNYSASILIKLYGRIADLDAAFKVLDEMPLKFGFRPNAAVYTTLMSSCTWNGRIDLAMNLKDRMMEDGQVPDEKTYSTLLRGASRSGQTEHLAALLWEALEQGGSRRLLDKDVVQHALQTIMKRRAWLQRDGDELLRRLVCAGYDVRRPCGEAKAGYERSKRHVQCASW